MTKTLTVRDLPKSERPREKLAKFGPEFLKDFELLAILLRTGTEGKNALKIAQDILTRFSKKRLLGLTFFSTQTNQRDWVGQSGSNFSRF